MKRRSGLTAIEVLFVIVIIVLIVAVLYVGTTRPRDHSHRSRLHRMACSSNLNQIATAMQVYMARFGGSSTFAVPAESFRGTDWLAILYWKGLISDPAVFLCPAQKCKAEMPMRADLRSYVWDGSDSSPHCEYAARGRGPAVIAHGVAETPVFTHVVLAQTPMAADIFDPGGKDPFDPGDKGRQNHLGGINVVFFDSHVEWVDESDLSGAIGAGGTSSTICGLEFLDDGE